MRKIFLTTISLFLLGFVTIAQPGSFTDTRDKEVYQTVTINGTSWMAQNLKFETKHSKELRVKKNKYVQTYDGGFGGAPECGTTSEYGTKAIACEHLKVVGRYYKVEDALEACPSGWHLATLDEWLNLFEYISDTYGPFNIKKGQNADLYYDRAIYLKSNFWNSTKEAKDPLDFSMMPDGYGKYNRISLIGTTAEFWTATPLYYKSGEQARGYYKMVKTSKTSDYMEVQDGLSSNYRSVRCVKDKGLNSE